MDRLLRGLLAGSDGAVRVVAAVTSDTCAEAARRHATSPAASEALARATSAALLLATLTKGDERVTVQILGDGPLRGATIDASAAGETRGFVSRPDVAAPRVTGRRRLGPLVGGGLVNVIRDLGLRDRYQGSSPLVSGEIDEDLEHHLTVSEQVESALGCDARLGDGGELLAAGGVLVQCLPGGDVAAVRRARERLRGGEVLAALAAGAADPLALARRALAADVAVLDERPVRFRCPCSRERVTAALALCGEEELRAMVREDGGAEVTCNFCGERYAVTASELERLAASLPRA
jgi:molecular chaperone Hsp33